MSLGPRPGMSCIKTEIKKNTESIHLLFESRNLEPPQAMKIYRNFSSSKITIDANIVTVKDGPVKRKIIFHIVSSVRYGRLMSHRLTWNKTHYHFVALSAFT